jgi:hypothetical protein
MSIRRLSQLLRRHQLFGYSGRSAIWQFREEETDVESNLRRRNGCCPAFTSMVNDPEFQTVLEERSLELGATSGEGLQERVNGTMDLPDSVVNRVIELLSDVSN